MSFVRFWFEYFCAGWESAHGIIDFIGTVALLTSAVLLVRRRHESRQKWEEFVMRASLYVFGVAFVTSTFFVVPYVKHEESQKEIGQLRKSLSDKSPKLEGFIEQWIVGEEYGQTNSLIFLQVSVGNSGGSPSVAEAFRLNVLLTNRAPIEADVIDFSDEYTLTAFGTNSVDDYVLRRQELISEKTSKAITPGEEPRGWIAFRLRGVLLSKYDRANYLMVLSFVDINGSKVCVTNGFFRGRLAEKEEDLGSPRTLPGSANLLVRRGPAKEQIAGPWLPPELAPGCSNVTVFFGGQGMTYPVVAAEIASSGLGTKFAIKDLPPELLAGLDKVPGYSPRKREMWFKLGSVKQDFGGKVVEFPVRPFVVSNRLYVEMQIPFSNEKRPLVMSDEFDSALSKIPSMWDRNYNGYLYEVVNEMTNPVLQVVYTKPNEIHVNGIFIVDTNSILESFGEPPVLKTFSWQIVDLTNNQPVTNVWVALGTNSIGEVVTNVLYDTKQPWQRAVFKYPSNRYPGLLAN